MHEKKYKGDVAVAQVIARLTEIGWTVGILITEHAKYDLLAEKDGKTHTVQVRHCSGEEAVSIKLSNSWADKKGNHTRYREKGDYTLLAVYVPRKGVFFIKDEDIGDNSKSINLRFMPSKNGQEKGVRWASDHITP